jgi:hypothetical protein
MSTFTYGYMWFMRSMESPCNCLAVSGLGTVYKKWDDLVFDMEDSLKRMQVRYHVNQDCTPEALHTHHGEMVYATYQNNYGSYIVKLVIIFD